MQDQSNVKYAPLPPDTDNLRQRTAGSSAGEAQDMRYAFQPREVIPWKSIFLAFVLLLLGTLLFILSYLIFTAHMGGDKAQAFGLVILGGLVFLPGFYETRIAYYSWRGRRGYTFRSIPE